MIHVIGDSHVMLFTGIDALPPLYPPEKIVNKEFSCYRLGAVLAYNLVSKGHTSQGRECLFLCLNSLPKKARVMLVFGEIDCRTQLVKQAESQSRSLESVALDCADNYFKVVKQVKRKHPVIVWGATPQSAAMHSSNKYPTVGTMQERNQATLYFNQALREQCEAASIPFAALDNLIDEDLNSDESYFFDSAHLSQKAFPMALEALEGII